MSDDSKTPCIISLSKRMHKSCRSATQSSSSVVLDTRLVNRPSRYVRRRYGRIIDIRYMDFAVVRMSRYRNKLLLAGNTSLHTNARTHTPVQMNETFWKHQQPNFCLKRHLRHFSACLTPRMGSMPAFSKLRPKPGHLFSKLKQRSRRRLLSKGNQRQPKISCVITSLHQFETANLYT